jgi:hypothetical protein
MENNERMSVESRSTQRRASQRTSQRDVRRKKTRRHRSSSASERFRPININRYDTPEYDIHFIDNLISRNKKNLVKIKTSKNRVYKTQDSKIVEKNIEELTKLKNKKLKQLGYLDRIRYNFNRLPKKDEGNVLRQSNTSRRFRLLTAEPTLTVRIG